MTWTTRPRSDFGSLAAIRQGQGGRILFIHGVGLRAEAWNAQMDALNDCVAVDLPGHGDSPKVQAAARLRDYTDAIAHGMDAPMMVVGHSMGAMIALDLAIRYPQYVQALVAMNAIYRRPPAAAAAVQARADSLDGVSAPDPAETLARWFGDAPSSERDACARWLRHVDPKAYQQAYRIFAHADGPAAQDLARTACPAHFITGGAEPNSTPAMSQALADLAPRGRAQIIDGAAHMMPMTHARQINAVLLDIARESFA